MRLENWESKRFNLLISYSLNNLIRKGGMFPLFRLFLMMLLKGVLAYQLIGYAPFAAQQTGSGISQPQAGDVISGTVIVEGTAVHPDYLRYELSFLYLDGANGEWIVFAEGDQPVVFGTLAVWDTTVGRSIGAPIFPDGRYQLRLRVVKTDYNYDEFFTTDLVIQNDGPTPTPTADETAVSLTATAVFNVSPAVDSDSTFQQATPLPSLTPFPTPTPQATPIGNVAIVTPAPEPSSGGLIGQVSNVRWERVGNAFVVGIVATAVLFGLGILYLLMRAIGRRVWRTYWHQQNKKANDFE